MQIASSARRTCIASVSAVEWTATVRMPISWQARWMRSAISPRLAMRTFWMVIPPSLDDDERLVELDRLRVDDEHFADGAGAGGGNLVHHLHRLDDQQGVAFLDLVARRDERLRARFAGKKDGADHRRL